MNSIGGLEVSSLDWYITTFSEEQLNELKVASVMSSIYTDTASALFSEMFKEVVNDSICLHGELTHGIGC